MRAFSYIKRVIGLVCREPRYLRALAGFTLIELITVLAIMTVISGLILADSRTFNSAILLRNLAYEVGLSIREAQLYGVAVRGVSIGSALVYPSYGVYFPSSIVGVSNANYILFADINADHQYDPNTERAADTLTVQSPFSVVGLCTLLGGAATCYGACPATPYPVGVSSCAEHPAGDISWLTISFVRPNPDAIVMTSGGSSDYSGAMIVLGAQNGSTRSVSVSTTGQIAVTGTGD